MDVKITVEDEVLAVPFFIGDLLKIEGKVLQGSCIHGDLYVCGFKYEKDRYKIELNLCTQINEDQLNAENLHVVVGIDFELAIEDNRNVRGTVSADVVSDASFMVHLPVGFLQGKFKITQYRLMPIGLLRMLYVNMFTRDVPARRNGCDPRLLTDFDVYKNVNESIRKAHGIEACTDNEKVMTSDDKKELTSVLNSLNKDKNDFFSNCLSYIRHINQANWIGNLSSVLRAIETAKKNVKSHERFLEKLKIKHEEKLEFVSVLKENKIRYVYKAEKLNQYMERDHCFVLFFHRKSHKNNPENYEKLLAFFQNFTKANNNTHDQNLAFLAVDRHVISKKRLWITPPKESTIYHISKSLLLSKDFMKDWESEKLLNIAKGKTDKDGHKLEMRGRLLIRCPKISCPNVPREWLCKNCGKYFDFGFNGCLHCNCDIFTREGTFLKNFQFRCQNPDHGFYFADYNDVCNDDLNSIVPIQNVSILVLGQKNVGKTTFIKSIISVLAYENWEEAHQKIAGLKEVKVLKTEMCRIYSVRFRNYNVKFIDTPGIDVKFIDTPGLDDGNVDSVKKILDCIRTFECLHGVCVLVKSHESENEMLTVQSSVKQILSLLHWNLMSNVVFCSTYYPSNTSQLGNTLPVLKDISTKIKLSNSSNLFHSFDLEFYDFFKTQCTDFDDVEILTNINVTPDQKVYYKNNWEKGAKEANGLLNFLITLKPQRVKETLDLNESRGIISKLLLTMFETMEDIDKNINTIRQVRKTIKNFRALGKDHPENVCTDECCVQYLKSTVPENRVCNCPNECYGDREDYDCDWKTHVYIHCGSENSEIQITTEDCEVIVRNKKNSKTEAPKNLENHLNLLQKEKEKIKEIGMKSASFLKNHAILADNFWSCDYLYCFLGPSQVENRESVVNYLKKIEPYKKEISKWFSKDDHGEFEDLNKLEQELRSLPIYGRKFKQDRTQVLYVGQDRRLNNFLENDSAVSSSSGSTLLERLFKQSPPLDYSMYNSDNKRESSSPEPGPSKIRKLI